MQTVCGVPIDWLSTGNMLQGLGTMGTAGVAVWAARGWKRQKLGERRHEQAERVLLLPTSLGGL